MMTCELDATYQKFTEALLNVADNPVPKLIQNSSSKQSGIIWWNSSSGVDKKN